MKITSKNKSPQWIRTLLSNFLESRTLEASLGDLEEKFQRRVRNGLSPWKAKLFFIAEGLGFLRMGKLKSDASGQTTINMIRHTFLFFGRLVRKDWSYYLVSMLGLTLSLTSFMFIMMFIHDELSYDQFHDQKDRLFRLTTHLKLSDVEYNLATSQFPAASALKSEIPEVDLTVRVFPQEIEFALNEKKHRESIIMADEYFFDAFSFTWLAGDREEALRNPASVVLCESMSKEYFGSEDPVGKTLLVYDQPLTVTGVIEDVPKQSHLKFAAVIPLQYQLNAWKRETGLEGRENKWFWVGTYTYVRLRDATVIEDVEAKLPFLINKYFPDRYKQGSGFHLQPLTDIHLTSALSNEMEPPGNILYVRLFSVVGVVIMIVSAINLVNLSSFKISSRMREVGIRKFLGQDTIRIIMQLSTESMLIGLLAFSIAIILCNIFLTSFNNLVQKELNLLSFPNLLIGGFTLIIILLICLMAVVRPAIRYAAKTSRTLLLQRTGDPMHAGERNILIGFQVCFSFVLLVFSFIVSSQIDYFKNKDLGFDRENVILIELSDDMYGHVEALKDELARNNNVTDVSIGVAPGSAHNGWRFVPEGGSEEKPFLFPLAWVDYNYLNTLKIKLLKGENLNPLQAKKDSLWSFLINKRAALELGWVDDPINRRMKVFAAGTTEIMAEGRVVGLIDDYHYESLHKPVKPVVLTLNDGYGTAMVRVAEGSFQETIPFLKQAWTKFSEQPFTYEILDEKLDALYANEVKLSNLILFFTIIALYLTCYGMFALSSLLFRSRLKEVTIRKVFGANQLNIITQFYSRYAAFTLAAIVTGVPVSFYVSNLWLQTFEYRIHIGYTFFFLAGGCIFVVGLLSVSYYLMLVAFSNPIKFLRSE
jgi:putative ABC transport system permease protein